MKEEKEIQHTCVDCGTQNCKFKVRTYPEFCPTTNLKEEDLQWALERYEEGRNHDIMCANVHIVPFHKVLRFICNTSFHF